MPGAGRRHDDRFATVDEMLDDARSRLTRVGPREAAQRWSRTAPGSSTSGRPGSAPATGEIPGSIVIERNHLEWRLHPSSSARLPQARPGQQWIIVCSEGYTSSLAADALNSLGIAGDRHRRRVRGLAPRPGCRPCRGWTPADQVVAVA